MIEEQTALVPEKELECRIAYTDKKPHIPSIIRSEASSVSHHETLKSDTETVIRNDSLLYPISCNTELFDPGTVNSSLNQVLLCSECENCSSSSSSSSSSKPHLSCINNSAILNSNPIIYEMGGSEPNVIQQMHRHIDDITESVKDLETNSLDFNPNIVSFTSFDYNMNQKNIHNNPRRLCKNEDTIISSSLSMNLSKKDPDQYNCVSDTHTSCMSDIKVSHQDSDCIAAKNSPLSFRKLKKKKFWAPNASLDWKSSDDDINKLNHLPYSDTDCTFGWTDSSQESKETESFISTPFHHVKVIGISANNTPNVHVKIWKQHHNKKTANNSKKGEEKMISIHTAAKLYPEALLSFFIQRELQNMNEIHNDHQSSDQRYVTIQTDHSVRKKRVHSKKDHSRLSPIQSLSKLSKTSYTNKTNVLLEEQINEDMLLKNKPPKLNHKDLLSCNEMPSCIHTPKPPQPTIVHNHYEGASFYLLVSDLHPDAETLGTLINTSAKLITLPNNCSTNNNVINDTN